MGKPGSETLEACAARILELRRETRGDPGTEGAVRRAAIDRLFTALLAQLAPCIRHYTRRYGLADMPEDAWQACAIGVHRALETFDPGKARFSTHVTWQIRGELQGLRHRVRLDQRDSARSAMVHTVSIEALSGDEAGSPFEIADAAAFDAVEAAASEAMAQRLFARLFASYGAEARPSGAVGLARERQILLAHFFGDGERRDADDLTAEQQRQVIRRVTRRMAAQAVALAA